jgi:hypothetical protein
MSIHPETALCHYIYAGCPHLGAGFRSHPYVDSDPRTDASILRKRNPHAGLANLTRIPDLACGHRLYGIEQILTSKPDLR